MRQLVATEDVCTSAAGISYSDIIPIPDQDLRYAQYQVIRSNGARWHSSRPGFSGHDQSLYHRSLLI